MRTIRKIERSIPYLKQRKKVAAYARVSMESERMHHSLSAQVSYYSSLIQKNPDWEYAGVYADYGISGTGIKKRQEFRRMLEDAEAGKIDIILTKSIQRFARNTVDLLQTVRHLKELGIEVREQVLSRESLYLADEVFMSGTAAEITPVRSVDGIQVGEGRCGPVTKRIQQAFFGLFTGETEDKYGWLDQVNH